MMDIEREIAICQFGQEIYSVSDLLNQFIGLDEQERGRRQIELFMQLREVEPTQADIDQAMVAGNFPSDYTPCFSIPRVFKSVRVGMHLNEEEPAQDYKFLLYLFKSAYQRHFALEKNNPNNKNWRYWDLSNGEIVQHLLMTDQMLVEEVYSNIGFRGEFASIAKLWYADKLLKEDRYKEPVPETQTQFRFVSYEEVLEKSIYPISNRNLHSIELLSGALEKALTKRYKLESKQIRKLIWSVVERHLKETYNRELY